MPTCLKEKYSELHDPGITDDRWLELFMQKHDYSESSALCLLEDGHAGPCEFTPTREISIVVNDE